MIMLTSSFFYKFSVRVRYAPSPTGMMHLGGLRTALFNHLFAKKNNGKFIVRIEDTDQNRNVEGSLQNIFDTLKWLNILPDESMQNPNKKYEPYVQSQRINLYKQIQKMMLKNNLAYPCFCQNQKKSQSLSALKKKNKEKYMQAQNSQQNGQILNQTGTYDGRCSKLTLLDVKQKILKGESYAVRLRGTLFQPPPFFIDENYGTVNFVKFDDFVIVKKDGWPTFHFANVIDDWKMNITHVIRGQEWLTNTSKHIYLYKLLGAPVPKFLHLPLIQNPNGKKLSKRDPTSSLVTLRKEYESEAIKNFIFRLGWNPKQQINETTELQILSEEQMIEIFTTQGITKSPAKFDIKILNYLNKKVLKKQWKEYQRLSKQPNLCHKSIQTIQQLKKAFTQKIRSNIAASSSWSEKKLLLIWQIIHQRITINSDIKLHSYFFKQGKLSYQTDRTLKDLKSLFGINTELKNSRIIKYDDSRMKKNTIILHNLRLIFEHVISENQFSQGIIAQKLSQFLFQNKQIQNQEIYHLLRFIITQQKSGPNILKVIIVIGRQRCLELLHDFQQLLKASVTQNT